MITDQIKRITSKDIEKLYGEKLSEYLKSKLKKYNFRYRVPSTSERDEFLLKSAKVLFEDKLTKAGAHRRENWELGWSENLEEFTKTYKLESIKPKYFGKYSYVRWNRQCIIPISKNFEENTLEFITDWIFDKYLREVTAVYEFGCGTGHNLLKVREINSRAELWGLDWARSSQATINQIKEFSKDKNIYAENFDFFHPNSEFHIKNNSAIITIAALEQVGDQFDKYINYLKESKANIVIHIEPIYELLDESNLLDFLSIQYFKKRNYSWGLLNYLKDLERKNHINIIKASRLYFGSMFIDGYSVVIWKPIVK